MDILSEFLPRKVEHITSSLYSSVLLWTSKLPFSMKKFPMQHPALSNSEYFDLQVGLKTLVIHPEEKIPPRVVHCYTIAPRTSKPSSAPPPPPPPPPPPSIWLSCSYAFRCTMIGDVLGAESGDCMTSEVVDQVEDEVKPEAGEEPSLMQSNMNRGKEKSEERNKRQFPPPITLLRTTTGRMPWAFKRECSDDGRLIIRAERLKRSEHVEAHRENGRVTMRLVPGDDDDNDDETECCEECGYPMNEEEEEGGMEPEDLEFKEESEGLECDEEEEEEDGGFEFEDEEELAKEGCDAWEKCSSMEEEGKLRWDLRESATCGGGGGLVQDSDSSWTGNGVGVGDANGFMGRPASASAPLRPITSVM